MAKRIRFQAESAFEDLAEDISKRAAAVECSPAEYRNGLTTIIEQLEIDRRASQETNPED